MNEILAKSRPVIEAVARNFTGSIEHDDLVQEGLIAVYLALDKFSSNNFNPGKSINYWVWIIVKNHFKKLLYRSNNNAYISYEKIEDQLMKDEILTESKNGYSLEDKVLGCCMDSLEKIDKKYIAVAGNATSDIDVSIKIGKTRQRVNQIKRKISTKYKMGS